MKDRIPTKPGRVQLVPSPDDDDLFILTRSDEPTQEGTPLNKASLLSDATAEGFGLTGDGATVNNALALVSGSYSRIRTGQTAPNADTEAKRGDIYIMDSGTERHAYLCDAVGEREVDLGADWERGNIGTGGVSTAATNRVRSQVVDVPAGTKFTVASGFKYALYRFNEAGVYVSVISMRTAAYTAASDMRFRIVIARVTESASEEADVAEFAAALTASRSGAHWTALAAAREVRKAVVFTSSDFWKVPADLRGTVTVQCFGGGAGGTVFQAGDGNLGPGGGGGHMATWTGTLDAKKYEITIGAGGQANHDGGATSFGSLCTAAGGSGQNGGTGGGGGGTAQDAYKIGGSGSYGGGGGSADGAGGSGGTYGGGGGGGGGKSGGSGKSGAFAGGSGSGSYGGGGGGWSAVGKNATSSTGGAGGAGQNTTGFGLDFEGTGAAGTVSGGGGGYGGAGGNGLKTGTASTGGGGGGYGARGGNAGTVSGGGGGGYGGPGGDGYLKCGGGGGGYGLSGKGGSMASGDGSGGIAAGGAGGGTLIGASGRGGDGCVVIYYTGIEVV